MSDSLIQQLEDLITMIEAEERRCEERLVLAHGQDLETLHAQTLATQEVHVDHARMRGLHEALFKVHRKIRQRHRAAIEQCRVLSARLLNGSYHEHEVAEAVEQLKAFYHRLVVDNERIEQERKQILSEHVIAIGPVAR